MQITDTENQITPLLRWVTAVEVAVLIVSGLGLFFLPSVLTDIWTWDLLPFNTRFLGAVYTASIAAAVLVIKGTWSPARMVVPMIFVFTIIVLMVSLVYIDRFELSKFSVWGWFILYIGIPINAAYHLWLYRDRPAPPEYHLPSLWNQLIGAFALFLAFYGIGLLILPDTFSEIWSWQIDDFHARMYSVAFLTPAVGGLYVYRGTTSIELLTLGLTQVAGGALSIIGLLIVDSSVKLVKWSAVQTWLWIGIFSLLTFSGVIMIALSRNPNIVATHTAPPS